MSKPQVSSAFRTKPVDRIMQEAQEHKGGLKRVLTAFDLTAIGVGAIIGAGIFVLTGTAAREAAGPGIMLSFVFAGFACIMAALCYAEFAARLPISGSAYTYAYATVGELVAWIIGWDLILEYTIGASAVAISWTKYLSEFLVGFGIQVPDWLYSASVPGLGEANIAAALIILILTTLLCLGVKESARFNAVMVFVKIAVLLLVIFAGMRWVEPANWDPFLPFGVPGIFAGAALIFFSYVGFDAVSTAAEEVKNPSRDLPIGIIASLIICTVLYIAVSGVLTGMVPYDQIDPGAPLAAAFGHVGFDMAQKLIGLGGVAGLTTVMLILLMSQPRIWYSMGRDGLLHSWFSSVHQKFRTPFNATLTAGGIAALMAAFVPMEDLHHMVSIGVLFAFVVVSGSVLIIRYKTEEDPIRSTRQVLWLSLGLGLLAFAIAHDLREPIMLGKTLGQTALHIPELTAQVIRGMIALIGTAITLSQTVLLARSPAISVPTTFKCPAVPWVPIIAMAANIYMMVNLNLDAWLRLALWLGIGMVIYLFYGLHHSKLAKKD